MDVRQIEVGDRVRVVAGPAVGLFGVVELKAVRNMSEGVEYEVRWEKPHDRAQDVEVLTRDQIVRAGPRREPFKVGDVVFMRGDLKLETPMTVIEVMSPPLLPEEGCIGVAWLDTTRQLCTHYTLAAAFKRHPEEDRRAGRPAPTYRKPGDF